MLIRRSLHALIDLAIISCGLVGILTILFAGVSVVRDGFEPLLAAMNGAIQ